MRCSRPSAKRLLACTEDGDTVARLGGDEFAIVQTGAGAAGRRHGAGRAHHRGHRASPSTSTAIRSRSASASASPCRRATAPIPTSCSRTPTSPSHRAKSEGRGIHRFFEPEMDADMQARSKLQLDLRKALANGEFELYYQPLVNLERDEIMRLRGAAALASSRARLRLAGRVHSAGRGDRAHRAARRMGDAAGLRRGRQSTYASGTAANC